MMLAILAPLLTGVSITFTIAAWTTRSRTLAEALDRSPASGSNG
jgi:hypothetical protein